MDNLIIINVGGIFHLGFAIFHIMFWKIFRWKDELSKLKQVNRAIMQVLNLCLTFCFIFFGYISIFYAEELIASKIGHTLLIFIALFWLVRAVEQVIFFNYKRISSIIIIILSLFVILLYMYPLISL